MIPSGRDAKWRKQFIAAPPKLQKAMNATEQAKETLKWFQLLGIDDNSKVAAYTRHLQEREQTERQIREALRQDQARPPISQGGSGRAAAPLRRPT